MRVLELGGIGPVPFAAMLLADMGADVVRVHRPADQDVLPNPVLDRGRRSVVIDLKEPRGQEVVRALAQRSHIIVEGFRPGVLERLGLDPKELRSGNAALVVGRMTGYGQDGPLAKTAGHDINYIALSGALAAIGRKHEAPTPPLNLVADFGGGGMMLALGVVGALHQARETGVGSDVDAAMTEGSGLLLSMLHGHNALGVWTGQRGDNLLDSGAPFYDTYRCADDTYLAVGAIEKQFFDTLVDVLELGHLLPPTSHRDRDSWPTLRKLLTARFLERPRADWLRRFEGRDACVTPVLDIVEAQSHPHNIARRAFLTDERGIVHPAPAPRFSTRRSDHVTPPPRPGDDTDEILTEVGMTPAEIEDLRSSGIVR